jgi:hypothetical protein
MQHNGGAEAIGVSAYDYFGVPAQKMALRSIVV